MNGRDLFRYGWRYAAIYVGSLTVLIIGNLVASMFFDYRPRDMTIAAFILAAYSCFNRFLKDRKRLPTLSEYCSLVLLGTAIIMVVDTSLTLYVIGWDWERDTNLIPLLLGLPLLKGLFGNSLFFSPFAGRKLLEYVERKNAKEKASPSA